MRIVDVSAFYSPQGGGVRTYVDRKLSRSSKSDDELIVVAPGARNASMRRSAGARLITLESPHFPLDRRYRYFNDERALHNLLDNLAPDVVEVSSPWASAAMVSRWRGRAVRSLVMHADPLATYAYRWFGGIASRGTIDRAFGRFWNHLRALDSAFDIVVSASNGLTTRLAAGGLGKVRTLPMGVEPGLFSPALRDERLRARLLARCGLSERATLLLGVGRHGPEKRWSMVIDGVAAAGNAHPVGLILLGDGPHRTRAVRAAGNNPHIHLAAPVFDRTQLAAIMASADALAHGCEVETFCIAAAEARASGLPLIVPDEGGAADHLLPGAGERYRARSAASLARAVNRFITTGPAVHRAQAERRAGEVISIDDHLDRLFDAYRGLRPAAYLKDRAA